jgi:hypothetical protein
LFPRERDYADALRRWDGYKRDFYKWPEIDRQEMFNDDPQFHYIALCNMHDDYCQKAKATMERLGWDVSDQE